MITSKLEVLVDFGTSPDEKLVQNTIKELKSRDGVKDAVFKDGAFMVETVLPNKQILDLVAQSSGKRAVLQGFGDSQSAVCMISNTKNSVLGVIRFQQSGDTLIADGSVDGLTNKHHYVYVTEGGDLSQGCESIGGPYNPPGVLLTPNDPTKHHAGDLGNITSDEQGRTNFRIVDKVLKLPEIIGRGVAITEKPILGQNSAGDRKDTNSGPVIACGIIARSAGIFQNPKRICQCDGVVVWDEKDKPLAGKGRREKGCCGGHGVVGGSGENKGVEGSVKKCCKF